MDVDIFVSVMVYLSRVSFTNKDTKAWLESENGIIFSLSYFAHFLIKVFESSASHQKP